MVFQTGPILVFASLVEICLQPAWSEPRRARRNGQSCAYEAPGMAHGDVDMPDVHDVSNCESRVLLTVVSAPPEHITQCTTHCTQTNTELDSERRFPLRVPSPSTSTTASVLIVVPSCVDRLRKIKLSPGSHSALLRVLVVPMDPPHEAGTALAHRPLADALSSLSCRAHSRH